MSCVQCNGNKHARDKDMAFYLDDSGAFDLWRKGSRALWRQLFVPGGRGRLAGHTCEGADGLRGFPEQEIRRDADVSKGGSAVG